MPFAPSLLCRRYNGIAVHWALALTALPATASSAQTRVATPVAASQSVTQPTHNLAPADLLQLELTGDLHAARSRLESNSNDVPPDHAQRVIALDEALKIVRFRNTVEDRPRNKALLAAYAASADPIRDAALIGIAQREIDSIDAAARTDADAHALQVVDDAKKLADAGKYDDAKTILGELTDPKAETISPTVARAANLQLNDIGRRADADQVNSWTGFWKSTAAGLRLLLQTGLFLLVLFAFWIMLSLLRMFIRRFPRPGTMLSLQDLTVASDSEREAASRLLGRDFESSLMELRQNANEPARLELGGDLDGTSVANLVSSQSAPPIFNTLVAGVGEIRVAGFSINPVVYLSALRTYLARPYAVTLAGSLAKDGEGMCVEVQALHCDEWPLRLEDGSARRWKCSVTEKDGGRPGALRQVARNVAFALNTVRCTHDLRSYQQMSQGLDLLRDADTSEKVGECEERLEAARIAFLRAVTYDPNNLLGRFYFAIALRKKGMNAEAIQALRAVFDMITRRLKADDPYLLQHREFGILVRYNLASTLLKGAQCGEASEILRTLLEELKPASVEFPAATAARLKVLCRSAHAATLLFIIKNDQMNGSMNAAAQNAIDERKLKALKDMEADLALLEADHESAGQDPGAYAYALAVVLNAYGQGLSCLGHGANAREQFDRAITMMPTFSDAYLNRARWRMDNWKTDNDWAENAEKDILEGMRLNPDQKAEYLLGKLYADPTVGRMDEAIKRLEAASLIPLSYLELGKILQQKGQTADAVQMVKRSITRFPKPVDYRYIAAIDWSLELTLNGTFDAEKKRLEELRDWAQLVNGSGKRKHYRDMAGERLDKIDAMLKNLKPPHSSSD